MTRGRLLRAVTAFLLAAGSGIALLLWFASSPRIASGTVCNIELSVARCQKKGPLEWRP